MKLNFEKVSRIEFIEHLPHRDLARKIRNDVCGKTKDTFFDLSKALIPFLDKKAIGEVVAILKKHNIVLGIETPRKRSMGRCFPYSHRIYINNDLDKDNFLAVFIHEYAHLLTFLSFPKVASHGTEFYYCFQKLVLRFIEKEIIPKEMFLPIVNYNGDYEFLKKHYQFVFELKTIRIGSKAIYKEEIIIRGKSNCGKIHCKKMLDNSKIQLDPHTKVLPVLDLEF